MAALFERLPKQETPKPAVSWRNELWHSHMMPTAIKMNSVDATLWLNLTKIVLRESKQTDYDPIPTTNRTKAGTTS